MNEEDQKVKVVFTMPPNTSSFAIVIGDAEDGRRDCDVVGHRH